MDFLQDFFPQISLAEKKSRNSQPKIIFLREFPTENNILKKIHRRNFFILIESLFDR